MDVIAGNIGRELAGTYPPGDRRLIWKARVKEARMAGEKVEKSGNKKDT